MAKYVVPPRNRKDATIIKCHRCKALYVPDHKNNRVSGKWYYEPCPVCGYHKNGDAYIIPLWKYNLIKFFRGGFREQPDAGGTDDQEPDIGD